MHASCSIVWHLSHFGFAVRVDVQCILMCAVVQQEFLGLSSAGADLLNQMLTYDPEKRISASAALRHPWFSEAPFPLDPSQLPTFPDTLDGNTR